MVIKKAVVNHNNGTSFDTLHYETQAKQVKVYNSSGGNVGDMEDLVFIGKLLSGSNLNNILDTGMYRITGFTNGPSGLSTSKTYIMNVHSAITSGTTKTTKQEIIDFTSKSSYSRIMEGSSRGEWSSAGGTVDGKISTIEKSIGSIGSLKTGNKVSLTNAVNEIFDISTKNRSDISSLNSKANTLENTLSSHNHDSRYLRLTGGTMTGKITTANNAGVKGRNTSGGEVGLAHIDSSNVARFGDSAHRAIVNASNGDLRVSNGSTTFKVFHAGNMGKGSGLDADLLNGVSGASYARRDSTNNFQGTQSIKNGNFYMDKITGGVTASIFFRNNGTQTGRIYMNSSGNMDFSTERHNLRLLKNGNTETFNDVVMNSTNRQSAVRFKLNNSDAGAGFYINNNTKQLGMHDWRTGINYFRTDRNKGQVKFTNSVSIQGHQLFIQSGTPSGASNGDIWMKI